VGKNDPQKKTKVKRFRFRILSETIVVHSTALGYRISDQVNYNFLF
jgi:hypothetical protein